MDEFPHIAVEHKVLKRHVHFRFNPDRCREAGLQETPNADKYEVIKLRRVYHFNRDTADHVVLTIPKPVFVVVDRDQLPEENSSKLKHNAEYATGEKSTYQNVKNTESRNEKCCCDTQEDEVIIEKCVPEVCESSNIHKKPTERFEHITVSCSDDLLLESTTNCDESKSKTCIFELDHHMKNNQKNILNITDGKNQLESDEKLSCNVPGNPTNQIHPSVTDSIPSHIDQSLSLEELTQDLQTNTEIGANELDTLSIFEELSIHEQIFNENPQENSKNISFGILSDVSEPIQKISAADEILWAELYESTAEEVSQKPSPDIYQSQSDPVEEEMRKIHGEYVAQDHSYVQSLDSNEEFLSSSRNVNLLELFKNIQEPVLEEKCGTNLKISHVDESFEVPPLVIDAEGDEELASEIRKFIVTQDGDEAEEEIENFDSCNLNSTRKLFNSDHEFENHSEIQDSSREQEKCLDLRKLQNVHEPNDKYVSEKQTIFGENEFFEKPISFRKTSNNQINVELDLEKPIPDGSDIKGSQIGTHKYIAEESKILKQPIHDGSMSQESSKNVLRAELFQSGPTWKERYDDFSTEKPIQDVLIVKSLQMLQHSPLAVELESLDGSISGESLNLELLPENGLNTKEAIGDGLVVKNFRVLNNQNNKHISEETKILEQSTHEESTKNVLSTELSPSGSFEKDFVPLSEIVEPPIHSVLSLVDPHNDLHSAEPIQDGYIVKHAQILEDSPIVQEPEVLESFISKQFRDLQQPIQNGLGAEKFIQNDPAMKDFQFSNNITLANEFKILKQSLPNDPISEMPQDLERPIQDGPFVKDYQSLNNSRITEKFETGEGPTHYDLIQEEPPILDELTQDSVQEPSKDCPIGEGSRIKYNSPITNNSENKEEPIFDNSIPEEAMQDSLNTEESAMDGAIPKSSQNFNNNISLKESNIQDDPPSENSQNLKQPIQDGLNAEEVTGNNNNIVKVGKICHNSPIPEESEIRDDSIVEEHQDLEQPPQENFTAEVPIHANSTVKDVIILNNTPVEGENPIPEELQVLEKPPQDCFNPEELIQDNNGSEILKKSLHNNSITEESEHFEQCVQDGVESKGLKESVPIVEKPHRLQQPVHNSFPIQKPAILKQPDEDNLFAKQLQVIIKPLPADIIENMSKFLKTPVKVHLNSKSSEISSFQNGPMERHFKCDSNFIHQGPKTFQKPFRSKSRMKDTKIVDKRVLKKPGVIENIIQSPVPKIYEFLEKPVFSPTEKITNLENSYEFQSQILKNILQSPNEKKHKLLENYPENYNSLVHTNKKEPKTLETQVINIAEAKPIIVNKSGKSKRQKVVKRPLQSTNQAVSNAFAIEQEHSDAERNLLKTAYLGTKLLGRSSLSCRSIEELCINGTVPKMSGQKHVEGELKILEKSSSILPQNDIKANNSRHHVVETTVNDTMGMGLIQNCVEQGFNILKKCLSDIEKESFIENPIRDDGLNLREKGVSDQTVTAPIQNPIDKERHILKKSPNTVQKQPNVIPIDNNGNSVVRKSRFEKVLKDNSIEERSSFPKKTPIVDNPFDYKSKIVKQPLDSTAEEVQKIRKKFQQVFRTPDRSTDTLFENEHQLPKKSLEGVRSENTLENRIARKKMLKSLDQSTENKPKSLEVPPQDNQIETSSRMAESIGSIIEMGSVQKHLAENCIPVITQNLEKHKQDTISKEDIWSPRATVCVNAFQEEMDDILTDPLEEELCRIHEESIAIKENRSPKEKSHPATLTKELVNRRPIFQEPLTKKSRKDYLEEELQFRGFTREEQSISLNLQSVYNSLVSVIEGIQDSPLDIMSVRDSPVSAIESVHDKSSCNIPVVDMFNIPSLLNGSNRIIRKQYKCNKCDFRANQRSHLKVHLRAHLEPFWCNLCSEAFAQIDSLENHVRRYHTTDINDCNSLKNKSNIKFNDGITLEKNLRSSRNSEKPFNKMNQQVYKCGFCDYCSSYIKRLQHHMKVHTREKLYSCQQCDYTTLNKWMIERHKNDHSKETQQYECEECGYITMYRNQLDEHLQLHSGQKLYKCDDCSFSTAHFGYFNAHVSFHQTKIECPSECGDDEELREKPQMSYKCLQCGYYTVQHAALWRHARMQHIQSKYIKVLAVNSNKEVYICTSCGYKAHSENMFNTHALIHTDVKPSKCQLCNFVADSEFNLRLHEVNHNESSFKCTKCRRSYLTLQRLANHVMKVHNGDT